MKIKLTGVLFLTILSLFAQEPTYKWTKISGSGDYDFGLSIDHDSFDNVYTVGYFGGTVDFDPSSSIYNLSSEGSSDIFIQKLDTEGNFLWAVSFGGSDYSDVASDVRIDGNDNVIVTGFFRGIVDFDPSPNVNELDAANYYKNFVLKLNSDGDLIWAKAYGRTSFSSDYSSIDVDNNGGIYTTGYFRDTADFDPSASSFNVTSNGFSDIYIHKLDAQGNFSWVRTMGSSNSHDIGHAIVVSDTGFIYSTGEFLSTVDFNTGAGVYNRTSNGIRDFYIHKLDTDGNFIWAKTSGGFANEIGYGITLDSNENIYTVGYMEDDVDFDPSSNTHTVEVDGYFNGFVAKFNSSGNFQWAENIGGTNVASNAYDIAIDNDNKLYVIGYFDNTVDFDFSSADYSLTSNGEDDFFVLNIDSDSNFIWAKSIGGSSWDIAYGIEVGPLNEIYTTGVFINNVDFDFTSSIDNQSLAGSSYHIFSSKWLADEALNLGHTKKTYSGIFPNPVKEKLNINFTREIENIEVNLLSTSGILVFKKAYQNSSSIDLELKNYQKGVYFLNLNSNQIKETHKLIID